MRHSRVRAKVSGTPEIPRLSVFRGQEHMRLQVIDDTAHKTLVSASEYELSKKGVKGTKTERARALGVLIAEKAVAAGIVRIVFDRGGNRYHGRVQAAAEGAREAGLQF